MRVFGLFVTTLYIIGVLLVRQFNTASVAQQITPTPTTNPSDYIYAILEDNNALLYCRVVRQPIDPLFQTATALASITPQATPSATKTTIAIPSATLQATSTLNTPTQEFAVTASPAPLTMTTTAALNLRECAGTACKVLLVIPINQNVTAFSERQLISGVWWRRVSFEGTVGWVSETFIQ